MDANFGLVHKCNSGQGPGLANARFTMFSNDDDVLDFVNSHHRRVTSSKSQKTIPVSVHKLLSRILFAMKCLAFFHDTNDIETQYFVFLG